MHILPSKTLSDGNSRHTLDRQFISIVIIIARLPFYYGPMARSHLLHKADHNDQRVAAKKYMNISAREWRISESRRSLLSSVNLNMHWVGGKVSWKFDAIFLDKFYSLPTSTFNFDIKLQWTFSVLFTYTNALHRGSSVAAGPGPTRK